MENFKFSTRVCYGRILVTPDLLPVFPQSIKFLTFLCQILKSADSYF